MNAVNLQLALDAGNPGQMAALSIFAASLSRAAAGKGTVPETITANTATYEAAPDLEEGGEATKTPLSRPAATHAEMMEQSAKHVAAAKEDADKVTAAKAEKPKRKRRSKAEIAADKHGAEVGAPPRNEDETAEDYLERVSLFTSSVGRPEGEEPTPNETAAEEQDPVAKAFDGPAKKETAADEPDAEVETAKASLRKVLSTKVKQHKDAIIKEFKKYDATNVSSLPAEHYEEFVTFLKGLS